MPLKGAVTQKKVKKRRFEVTQTSRGQSPTRPKPRRRVAQTVYSWNVCLFAASAARDGHLDVLRAPAAGHHRQSIVGRGDFFVRFGDKEREAMANFDFLDDLSATSPGSADSACDGPPPQPPLAARDVCRRPPYYTCSAPSPATADCRRQRRHRRRRYSGLSLSDSCGDSD